MREVKIPPTGNILCNTYHKARHQKKNELKDTWFTIDLKDHPRKTPIHKPSAVLNAYTIIIC